MRASIELNEGKSRLHKLLNDRPPDSAEWNEAQNRFQFIDRFLLEVLGWEHNLIRVEDPDTAGGKIDYSLGNPPRAILEAKRESKLFDFPAGIQPNRIVKLATLLSSCKNFREAFDQIVPYCAMRGAATAIICNGPQLVIFPVLVPGVDLIDGECYVFDGFKVYLNNFQILWNLLAPESIDENRAYNRLSLHRNPRLPPKASIAITEPMRYRYRSEFQEHLRDISNLLLDGLESDPQFKADFYSQCYVRTDANSRYLLLSKRIIDARYKRVSDDGVAPLALDEIVALDDEGSFQLKEDAAATFFSSKPLVVVGDVGVGKTTFFENIFKSLDDTEKAETYFVHINLGDKANLANDIKSFVIDAIASVLKNTYNIDIFSSEFVNSIYYSELQGFDRQPSGKLKGVDDNAYLKARVQFLNDLMSRRDNHLHATLGHLNKGRKKRIILVIDNADQRNFQTQQDAFLIAQELAATRNLIVFIALRPSTFYQSKMSGSLSGYQNRLLTISPPPADQVIEKRLSFAIKIATGDLFPGAFDSLRVSFKDAVVFFKATLRSIKSNDDIKQFLSNITGGNTRSVIELVTGFCGSPNVDSEKIVEIERTDGDYKVPLHEFTKHALLGDYSYFNELSSNVACNIYDVSTTDQREHFLASLIVGYLASPTSTRDRDGYVSGVAIVAEIATLGFTADQIRFWLRKLASRRLIETPHAHFREVEVSEEKSTDDFHFRATSIGIYHIRFWGGNFAFLDATSTDTPIFDAETRGTISQMAQSFEIGPRFRKTEAFRGYLLSVWHKANFKTNYYDFATLIQVGNSSFVSVDRALSKFRKPGISNKWRPK